MSHAQDELTYWQESAKEHLERALKALAQRDFATAGWQADEASQALEECYRYQAVIEREEQTSDGE